MELLITHGYMLTGTGSNVYVQNLCRALVRAGHEVHLLCQEPHPTRFDFVNRALRADSSGVELLAEQRTPYPGRCSVYRPQIGDLLPVYVYDEYPGWRVKTFLDLTEEEFEEYLTHNAAALRSVLELSGAEAGVTNHSVPGPLIARRALKPAGIPYISIVHGSCLQYVARRSARYMRAAREGLEGAAKIVALSEHSAGTVAEDFPDLAPRTIPLPGGVDTTLFSPANLDLSITSRLSGGPGRGPEQREAISRLARETPGDPAALATRLREISGSYDARRHDQDAGDRLERLLSGEEPLIVYVGKLIHSKGVHSLLAAFRRVHRQTGGRLLIVGFGTFREPLELLNLSLKFRNEPLTGLLAASGRRFESGEADPLEHFDPGPELYATPGAADAVEFVGPLYHEELSRLLPRADAAVVPSIFPETFGLVAAEFAASGVVPFVADHSGLREAGEIIGKGLDFDLRVSLSDGFQTNLAGALADYLERPVEERRAAGRRVRENCVRHLSWEALAERLVELAVSARRA
ncbi:glycosyltransferase [Rubrobacter taiwanensis]|jgi:glycosyltransferase involved in cell wall biosynthesis|uniref:Glycosyltransferase n=1 Tax=Rubrobacter taiwanensis TaxID=185139 RepID=A0A4R1BM05_9ACTN|nr:glycosyltransferase family 4 protein [Rubrobacter taiwanensis]TCJ18425.1 glycosyltransferase [Rubrobacter taiwanensis]